eukprot:5304622-Pyramimonas_sp.AAC.1
MPCGPGPQTVAQSPAQCRRFEAGKKPKEKKPERGEMGLRGVVCTVAVTGTGGPVKTNRVILPERCE